MADVFATVAGVVSVIDVALRGCSVLYSSLQDLKHEKELSRQLHQTIKSVESILRLLDEFVAVYRQQQASAGLPVCLPDAVNHEVIFIKAELDTLSTLLPAPSVSGQLRRRVKSLLDRKRVIEVVKKLDSHQITLTLALQSFAQRNGINFQEQLTQTLGQIERQQGSNATEVKEKLDSLGTGFHAELGLVTQAVGCIQPAQERLGAGLNDLHGLVSTWQNAASEKFDAINLLVSQMRVDNNRVRSCTVITAPTDDVLGRVIRAQFLGVIMPIAQQCFATIKADSGRQLDEISKRIDRMMQQLMSESGQRERENVRALSDDSREISNEPTRNHRDLTASAALCTPDMTAFSMAKRQTKVRGRRVRHWWRSWKFRWTIGTLWVTVSTTTTDRRTPSEFHIGGIPSPQKAYRVTIEFLPAQSLVQLRGLTLSVANSQDQRGYSQICPFLSTFAVVSSNADVMRYARHNNVDGLQDLFEKRLAAPSDRTKKGETPLMFAARAGAVEACKLLLDEGSDPLAMDAFGYNSSDEANFGFFSHPQQTENDYLKVIELLLQAENNVIEDSKTSTEPLSFVDNLFHNRTRTLWERTTSIDGPYIQRVKRSGLWLNDSKSEVKALGYWAFRTQKSDIRFSSSTIKLMLRTLLGLGANLCARDGYGPGPLYGLTYRSSHHCNEALFHNTLEVATALLKNGADPYALNLKGISVFDIAEDRHQMPILVESLKRAGYGVDEVRDEIERRQWCFFNPDHGYAESTAVDDTQIGPPSAEGLVLRKGARGDRLED